MTTTAITAVSAFLNEGRLRHGDLAAVEVETSLWEQGMDEVSAAGGEVGFDYFVIDGVRVRPLTDGDTEAVFVLEGSSRREPLRR
jgi:hypothetical protein